MKDVFKCFKVCAQRQFSSRSETLAEAARSQLNIVFTSIQKILLEPIRLSFPPEGLHRRLFTLFYNISNSNVVLFSLPYLSDVCSLWFFCRFWFYVLTTSYKAQKSSCHVSQGHLTFTSMKRHILDTIWTILKHFPNLHIIFQLIWELESHQNKI